MEPLTRVKFCNTVLHFLRYMTIVYIAVCLLLYLQNARSQKVVRSMRGLTRGSCVSAGTPKLHTAMGSLMLATSLMLAWRMLETTAGQISFPLCTFCAGVHFAFYHMWNSYSYINLIFEIKIMVHSTDKSNGVSNLLFSPLTTTKLNGLSTRSH